MKLYDVPRNTMIRVIGKSVSPPGAPAMQDGDIVLFDHLDGMFSFCCEPKTGRTVFLPAWQEVEIVVDTE